MPPLASRARRVLSALIVGGAMLATAASASAATPGSWTQLPQSTRSPLLAQPWPLRLGDGSLEVAYEAKNPDGSSSDILSAQIAATGGVAAKPAIATAWATLSAPALVAQPGGIAAFFGGLHSTDQNDPNQDLNYASSAGPDGPWTVAPGTASATDGVNDDQAYGSDVSAATLPDGTPLEAWAHTLGVTVHRGIGSALPNQDFQAQLAGCCGYNVMLAVDGVSGQPAIAWFSNATGHTGYYEQAVDPATGAPVGTPTLLPASQVGGNSIQPGNRVAFTGRPGQAGLYAAYGAGYPSQTRVLVWKVGATAPIVISSGDRGIRNVAIAADPTGRLWVVWTSQSGGDLQLFASRSNADGTVFDQPIMVPIPSGANDSFALAASAQAQVLDILGTFGPGPSGAEVAISSTQLQPGADVQVASLTVTPTKQAVATVKVADAGKPLSGATVTRITGKGSSAAAKHKVKAPRARTNRKGVAKLKLGTFKRSTKVRLKITKKGYTTRIVTLKIKVKKH